MEKSFDVGIYVLLFLCVKYTAFCLLLLFLFKCVSQDDEREEHLH